MHRLVSTVVAAGASVLAVACGGSPTAPMQSRGDAQVGDSFPRSPLVSSTITFAIDTACRSQFPEMLQQRSYPARAGDYAGVLRLDGDFLQDSAGMGWNVMYRGSRDGSGTYLGFNDPPLWERVGVESYVLIYGYSEYRSTSETGEWPFWGRVTFCAAMGPSRTGPTCAVPEITCESSGHRVRVAQN